MNSKNRIELVHLLGEELHTTALKYEQYVEENKYPPNAGYGDFTNLETKTAIQRRITVLREELLELSKSL